MERSRRNLWLAAILIAEALLFAWKCNHFFNGDSLFFFSHRIESLSDIWRVFKGPDHLWQYRPLTFVIFTFILNPLFGLNPLGYNLLPLFVHAANTLIVFAILRRLGLAERAALLGAFFFGTHCVAFYVTYGVAFLPDFSYSFFYLLSVFFFLKYLNTGMRHTLFVSIVAFILAIFCKEAAITLPAVVFTIALLWGEKGFSAPAESFGRAAILSLRRTFAFLLLGAIYLGFHWMVKAGQIYGPGINHPHNFEFSLYSLHLKYKYLKWAFNLPDGLVFRFEGFVNYVIALAILIFVVPFVVATIHRLWRLDRLTWFGSTWFLAALSPVLFLRNLTMHHNLYVPLVGLALLVGFSLDGALERLVAANRAWQRWTIPVFCAVCMMAVFFHNLQAVKNSWIAEASTIAETSLKELKNLYPALPDGTTLYIVDKSPAGREGPQWFYDYGSLFKLFYPTKSFDVQFIGRDGGIPMHPKIPGKTLIFEYDGFHLSESTGGI